MALLLKRNNAKTTLNGAITTGTSIVVTSATKFPTSGNFLCTIWDKVTYPDPSDDTNMEIVKVTSVSGNTFTVTRGQESTSNVSHASGSAIEMLLTKGHFDEIETELNTWSSNKDCGGFNLSNITASINAQTGTTYTLASTDSGKIVEVNNASAITITLPNNLAVGFYCTIVQIGAGQITLSPSAGATLHNKSSFTKTSGQWAMLSLYITTNSGGSSAVYVLGGDGA